MGLFGKKEKTFSGIEHVTGLEIPEKCKCALMINEKSLTINSAGSEYTLVLDRIRNIECKMDIDIEQYLKSSVLKGVIGAATFGVVGAIIGTVPKQKKKREVICYAIITYIDVHGNDMIIILKDENANTAMCAKFTDELRPKIKPTKNKVVL